MRCECPASEWAHHHASGGVYPCDGYSSCRRCQDADAAQWHDLTPKAPRRTGAVSPREQVQRGRQYILQRYGSPSSRDQQPETD